MLFFLITCQQSFENHPYLNMLSKLIVKLINHTPCISKKSHTAFKYEPQDTLIASHKVDIQSSIKTKKTIASKNKKVKYTH